MFPPPPAGEGQGGGRSKAAADRTVSERQLSCSCPHPNPNPPPRGEGGPVRTAPGGRLAAAEGLEVDPGARVSDLSVGLQQRVEILKALYRGARLLVLDEPTAVLTPPEAERLFEVVRQLTAAGSAVIFITHKLAEVM